MVIVGCRAPVIGGPGLTETMHQQLGSDMVTSPSFSDMKHHVPNEGINVEASAQPGQVGIRIACMRCAGCDAGT